MENREILSKNPEVIKIFNDQAHDIHVRVDRAMSVLMLLQWVGTVLMALLVSPLTWIGEIDRVQENIYLALIFGGILALPPIYLAKAYPGRKLTRVMMAIAQVCFSTLFIHLSGGRIETHFHIFGSLAFLAFYKDASILLLASAIVIADHFFRGMFMPMSIYGEVGGYSWRWVEHSAWVLFEDAVLIWGISRIKLDLKDMAIARYQLMKARESALESSALKSSFLSNMSHEIRTPLNSIIGFSDILKDTPLNEEQEQFVHTIHRCSDSLLHLLNDILDFSKMENGLLVLDPHPFEVQQLHSDIQSMYQMRCSEKGILLQIFVEDQVPPVLHADSHRIRQVLLNLVSNAVKFTEQGQITIRLKKEGLQYQWSVQDTGVGMSPEALDKIFDVFIQAAPSVSRKYGGTGLGLAISKNLVELMGGTISVQSQEGQGTTFTFQIPEAPTKK